jgi:hypothetical protein
MASCLEALANMKKANEKVGVDQEIQLKAIPDLIC